MRKEGFIWVFDSEERSARAEDEVGSGKGVKRRARTLHNGSMTERCYVG